MKGLAKLPDSGSSDPFFALCGLWLFLVRNLFFARLRGILHGDFLDAFLAVLLGRMNAVAGTEKVIHVGGVVHRKTCHCP